MQHQNKNKMESEFKNSIKLWFLTISSMFYCYHISSKITKGFPRLISISPVIVLLLIFPFNLHSFHLGASHVVILSWLTNFKLISFAFDQGPLSQLPPKPHLFILTACSAFKIKRNPLQENGPKVGSLNVETANRATMLVLVFCSYNFFKQYFHEHYWSMFFYVYFALQFLFGFASSIAQILLPGVELEPQFNEPFRATSLQDFWGNRWNRRTSDTLRSTIYNPIKTISKLIIGPRWSSLPAVFATFVTSGLMHDLLYYHITRVTPTWEVTWFFVLQGVLVDLEIFLKKKLVETGKFRLHETISGPLALANITITGSWLLYTQLLRNGAYEKIIIEELNIFVKFLKGSA